MNFQQNIENGKWLSQLNGKTIEKIYQVDFNKERHEDIYLPWLFFVTFSDFDNCMEIEGDFDGSHIKVNLIDSETLKAKLAQNNLPNEPDMWQVYETKSNEILGQLLGQKVDYLEFGIDKDEFEINGAKIKGQKECFNFIRFITRDLYLTIFEGSATGLGVTNSKELKLDFEDTFETFKTN